MLDRRLLDDPRLLRLRQQAVHLIRSRRLRRIVLVAGIVLLLFALLGFLAAPPLLKSQLQARLPALLGRPVSVGAVHLNPFTLRLELDHLHVGEPQGSASFLDIDRLVLNASWTSLFRRAPVFDAITVDHPQLHLVRVAPQQFNCSDLLTRFDRASDPHAAPARFVLANISVHDGEIRLDDEVLKTHHLIDQLDVGIPFIANLPADTGLYVQPLLAARVDGSTLRIGGQTKPFAANRESSLSFQFDQLDLPRYVGYLPMTLPVAITRGHLSGALKLHFLSADKAPQLRVDGSLVLADLAVNTADGQPLLTLARGSAALVAVQPLISRYRLGLVLLDQAHLHYRRDAAGRSNLDALMAPAAGSAPPSPTPASPTPAMPASVTPASVTLAPATALHVDMLSLQESQLDYRANGGAAGAVAVQLKNLHGSLRGLDTTQGPAATLALDAQLDGGNLATRGKLDPIKASFIGSIVASQVALAPLQGLLPELKATIHSGTLDASLALHAEAGTVFNLQLAPSQISLRDVSLSHGSTTPLRWQALQVHLAKLDLAKRQAQIDSVSLQGLALDLTRQQDGQLDLSSLIASPAATHPGTSHTKPHATPPALPAWQWSVARLDLDQDAVTLTDRTGAHPVRLALEATRYRVQGLSSDLRQPLTLALTGALNGQPYTVNGSVRPQPLDARLRIDARGIEIAPLHSLISVPLNVNIGRALLSVRGDLRYRDRGRQPALIDYRGDATLGLVRVLDKLSGDDFLRWQSLAATRLAVQLGEGAPHVTVGGLALNDFYARLIINSNGRLNLQDVITDEATAPVSVTRAVKGTPGAAVNPPAATPTPAESAAAPAASTAGTVAGPPAAAPAAHIQIGQVTLARGQLNYTDNFIKPNYSANITGLTGSIGAFGTEAGAPAALVLQGKLDHNSPLDINGSINPLTPVAFLDIKAKADGVELTRLTPYAAKYAGYPITSGLLNVDVHYQLDQRKLTADNHIFIDQLTFGDRIEGAGIRHLPVKLALALLKNARGEVDLHIPVTGSLDNPQFSVGSLVWHALVNLIGRAVTSPFRLLASIGGGQQPDLGYVVFAPGSAVLDPIAQGRLAALLKLLQQRPSLKLDITGRVDPAVDEKGLRAVMVDDLIEQQASRHGAAVATAKLTPDQYAEDLKKVYRQAKFPKPKNLIGLTKAQPPQIMRQLLETNMPVDAAALRALAERRASTVQTWLQGKLPPARITLHAPVVDAKGIKDKGKTTRVDFGLH